MLENVGRKVTLIVILLLISVGLMVVPRFMDPPRTPFRLGLDLQGGTRIVYRFDFAGARERGEIGANEDPSEILSQTVGILRNRVDPTGTKEISVRTEGEDRIVIELPGGASVEGTAQAESTLGTGIDEFEREKLDLADGTGFSTSGVVEIGNEQIRYDQRNGNTLLGLSRSHNGKLEAHAAGVPVRLVNSDAIRAAIENLGELSFQLIATDADFVDSDTDLSAEQQKLTTWTEANPGVPVVAFNQVPVDKGGPDPSIHWYPYHYGDEILPPRPVLVPKGPSDTFRGDALQRVYYTQDDIGYPAVGFEMRTERSNDFSDFTGDNINRQMAIVLNDEIRTSPNLNTRLDGGGRIEGHFKDEEVKNLVTILRSGSLRLKPILEHDERVGATLGDDYVKRGLYSSVLAMALVLAFMMVYYRQLGVFSALALLTNLIMFMGGLAFLQATLTLPGIAGIVLTVGMAVDANILIFDRLREEADKGRNPKQAAKAGFEMATSAIVDSNVTTFLTAVILYKLGSGPVRGFAVTLMIGILTSVFAALVTTRVFVHWALTRGKTKFSMGRWLADANYDFMSKMPLAIVCSSVVCVGGLIAFAALDRHEKLGIDFTGGVEAQLETAKAEDIDTLRARVGQIPGIGESAEVKPVLNSGADGGYTQFRVSFKTTSEETGVGRGEELRPVIEQELKDILLDQPIQVALASGGDGAAKADIELFFEVPPTDVQTKTALEGAGLRNVEVALGERLNTFKATGTTATGRDPSEVRSAISDSFRKLDPSGAIKFSQPIPSFSQVGPQVVGELRDKALLALAVSLLVTVLYIRVRFAEYSFGWGAMVALVHDVLVTLAALSIGNHFGIINGELNLAMIAVFLTIIGYSVNDTIVIFDRIRENLPKSDLPLRDVLNKSINETLSRTVMTSVTVFLAILVQYIGNFRTGNVLESISYAMLFGTVSGVYSTIFIANPIFLWLETRGSKKKGGAQARARREEEERRREEQKRREGGEDDAFAGVEKA